MPTYTYECETCGEFDSFRKMSERESPIECPTCHVQTSRVLIKPVMGYVHGEGSDMERRKQEEDARIFGAAKRARALKDQGVIPNEEIVHANDKRLQ